MFSQQPSLKTVVFAESHDDPITGKILAELVKKNPGFSSFLDERPKGMSFREVVEENNNIINQCQLLMKEFTEAGLDFSCEETRKKFFLTSLRQQQHISDSIYEAVLNSEDWIIELVKNVGAIWLPDNKRDEAVFKIVDIEVLYIPYYSARLSFKYFFELLEENNIPYKAIDARISVMATSSPTFFLNTRDSTLGRKYARFIGRPPALGRIGLLHLEGVFKSIVDYLDMSLLDKKFVPGIADADREALANSFKSCDFLNERESILRKIVEGHFCFFYIYSRPTDEKAVSQIRSGEKKFNFEVNIIDASNKNTDELMELILAKIKAPVLVAHEQPLGRMGLGN